MKRTELIVILLGVVLAVSILNFVSANSILSDPEYLKVLNEFNKTDRVPVIIGVASQDVREEVISSLSSVENESVERLPVGDSFSAEITREGLAKLVNNSNVRWVNLIEALHPDGELASSSAPPSQTAARLEALDESTIEATVLSLSTELIIVNDAGITGTLHGGFAKVRVDKILNHTRYDPREELEFNPLVVGETINLTYNSEDMSIGDKIFGNIERGYDYGGVWVAKGYEVLHEEGMINSSANVSYDSAILNAFENQTWVRVIVELKDDSGVSVTGTEEERQILLKQRDDWFKPNIDGVLSTLSSKEFNSFGKDSTGFNGEITQEGFNKLINDLRVRAVYLDATGSISLDQNSSINKQQVISKKEGIEEKGDCLRWASALVGVIVVILVFIYFFTRAKGKKKR